MDWKKIALVFVFFAIVMAACGNSGAAEMAASEAPAAEPAFDMAEEMPMEEGEMAFRGDEASMADVAAVQEGSPQRLIIRTGDMSIVVTDTKEAMDRIGQMAEEGGGWVVSSNVFQYDENAETGNMTVRVPAAGFQSFLEAVQLMAVDVTRVSTSGQDVTEEYVDLSSRLDNLEATAARVRNFLDETKDVEEALAVNQELSRLEGEIEVIKGRMQYLEQSAAFSTVSIDLTPDVLSQPLEVGGWQPQGVAKSALESLISALQTLVDLAIWLLIFVLPIVVIIAIPILLLIFFIRRWRRRRQARKEERALGVETVEEGPIGAEED